MKAKVIGTTDGKYTNEVIDIGSGLVVGETVEYKDLQLPIDKVTYYDNLVKVSCSNYVLVLRIIKD